jgi:DNA-directed RNA polymerase specialized sigma24 family protein
MCRKIPETEAEVVALIEKGLEREAVNLGLAAYGRCLRRFTVLVTQSEAVADDAYGAFCEDLWKSIASGKWQRRCSFLSWSRRLAWHAALREIRVRGPRVVALTSSLAVTVEETSSQAGFGSSTKESFAVAFAELSPEERAILVLRAVHALSWDAIARLFASDEPSSCKQDLARLAGALKVRYLRIKRRLHARLEGDAAQRQSLV